MPYCGFCSKLCPTVPGVNQHINITPKCKKASCEEFSQYVNDIWDNVPENPSGNTNLALAVLWLSLGVFAKDWLHVWA